MIKKHKVSWSEMCLSSFGGFGRSDAWGVELSREWRAIRTDGDRSSEWTEKANNKVWFVEFEQ